MVSVRGVRSCRCLRAAHAAQAESDDGTAKHDVHQHNSWEPSGRGPLDIGWARRRHVCVERNNAVYEEDGYHDERDGDERVVAEESSRPCTRIVILRVTVVVRPSKAPVEIKGKQDGKELEEHKEQDIQEDGFGIAF